MMEQISVTLYIMAYLRENWGQDLCVFLEELHSANTWLWPDAKRGVFMSPESTQKLKPSRTHSTLRRSRAYSDASYIHINMNLLWLFFWYEDPGPSLSLDLTETHAEKIRVEREYPVGDSWINLCSICTTLMDEVSLRITDEVSSQPSLKGRDWMTRSTPVPLMPGLPSSLTTASAWKHSQCVTSRVLR